MSNLPALLAAEQARLAALAAQQEQRSVCDVGITVVRPESTEDTALQSRLSEITVAHLEDHTWRRLQ